MRRVGKPSKYNDTMSEAYLVRCTPAQRELLAAAGTAEVYRNAMIERAKENLGMSFQVKEDLVKEHRNK